MNVRVVVLTEDSAENAFDTLTTIYRDLLSELKVEDEDDPLSIVFFPLPQAKAACRATAWKAQTAQGYRQRIDLARFIATELLRERTAVFFHYDGDVAWSNRSNSDNAKKFQDLLRVAVDQTLRAARPFMSDQERQRRMLRLVEVDPYYCIESWLFLHTEVALAICRDRFSKDTTQFQEWSKDPSSIDEVLKPWEQVWFCNEKSKEFNAQLARKLPLDRIYEADTSFARFVQRVAARIPWSAWRRENS